MGMEPVKLPLGIVPLYCVVSPPDCALPVLSTKSVCPLFLSMAVTTSNATVTFDVVTAMLKNNGQTAFVLKTGNAQSGGLTTQYNGTIPNGSFTGSIPMHQEGGTVRA